ncbi:hypothetical protein Hypma_014085 [Hypsizygus marmoreus]|uniref:Uncharacterized protein n=1 Tax=Hypsizygus marmoreus TaxID=39966 RepID=A0A369KB79_HYPMA|nr:hypothetical protein Hypma_014085 [Hypsizygus marmoreus]
MAAPEDKKDSPNRGTLDVEQPSSFDDSSASEIDTASRQVVHQVPSASELEEEANNDEPFVFPEFPHGKPRGRVSVPTSSSKPKPKPSPK